MTTTWTPGPWKVKHHGPVQNGIFSLHGPDGLGITDLMRNPEEKNANARLIAQAPAMAELLARYLDADADWAEREVQCIRDARAILRAVDGYEET